MSHGVSLGRVPPPHMITCTTTKSLVVCCRVFRQLASFQKVNWLLAISQQKWVALQSTFEVGWQAADHWLLVQLLYRKHNCWLASRSVHLPWVHIGCQVLSQVFLSLSRRGLSTGPKGKSNTVALLGLLTGNWLLNYGSIVYLNCQGWHRPQQLVSLIVYKF